MLRAWFLGFLHFDFDFTCLVSWFLAGPGSGGERNGVEVVPPPQPMAGMDADLTDNSGRIDSSVRSKFVLPDSSSFLGF